jgi:hypothetical protein
MGARIVVQAELPMKEEKNLVVVANIRLQPME